MLLCIRLYFLIFTFSYCVVPYGSRHRLLHLHCKRKKTIFKSNIIKLEKKYAIFFSNFSLCCYSKERNQFEQQKRGCITLCYILFMNSGKLIFARALKVQCTQFYSGLQPLMWGQSQDSKVERSRLKRHLSKSEPSHWFNLGWPLF